MKLVEVTLKLPERLASWLSEFSKHIGMTPDQFVATILEYYYDAWLVGKSSAAHSTPLPKDYCSNIEQYLDMGDRSKRHIIREFINWACQAGRELNKESINLFLQHYSSEHELNRTTVYRYRAALVSFLRRVRG